MNWAYLAGIIDGEGTITMMKIRHQYIKKKTQQISEKGCSYSIGIIITNTNKKLLEEIKQFLGCGTISITKTKKSNKSGYRWQMWKREQVKKILQSISPDLIVKEEHAKLALQYFYEFPFRKGNLAIDKKQAYFEKFKQLNKKGVNDF